RHARGVRLAHGAGAAREDHAGRVVRQQLLRRDVRADDHGVDAQLAEAAGDEARVLRAEIDYDDALQGAAHSSWGNTTVIDVSSGTLSVTGAVSRDRNRA